MQVEPDVRQPVWQVPAGQPRLAQHSLDALQEDVAGRQGAGWHVPDGHCSPTQQSLDDRQLWPWSAQPVRGAHLLSVQVPEQHWLGVSHQSSVGRQPASHAPWVQRSPAQQSRLVEQTPPGMGLHAQTPGFWPSGSPQPKEQHSSCAPHAAPTCLQTRGRQLQPERDPSATTATTASQRPFVMGPLPGKRRATSTATEGLRARAGPPRPRTWTTPWRWPSWSHPWCSCW